MTNNLNFFSSNLKILREKKGLNQSQILDFKRTQWTNYENGISYPKFIDLIRIANFFDITETDLIHYDLNKPYIKEANSDKYIELLEENRELSIMNRKLARENYKLRRDRREKQVSKKGILASKRKRQQQQTA